MMNVTKLAALAFTSLEYFYASKEEILTLEGYRLKKLYKYDESNSRFKKIAEKKIAEQFKLLVKHLNDWERVLTRITKHFENGSSADAKTVDFSIDLLHRTLDKFTVSDETPVEDKVKNHIFESLDRIKATERSEQDSLRLNAAFDNFLITNKLVSNGK